MIPKEKLLKVTEDGIRVEEKAVPIYLRHISSTVSWYGFNASDEEKIKKTLRRLANDSETHKKILEDFRKRLLEDSRDAY